FLYDKQLFDDAIIYLNKLLVFDEFDSHTLDLLYKSYWKTGNKNRAAEIGEKLLKTNPSDISILSDLANLALSASNNNKAFVYLERIIKISPEDIDVWKKIIDLTDIAISSGKQKEALIYLDRIIAIKPDDIELQIKKATYLTEQNKEKESLDAWRKIHELDSENLSARIYLGIDACQASDFQKSCEFLELVVSKTKNEQDKDIALLYYVFSLIKVNNNDERLPSLFKHLNPESQIDTTNILHKNMLEEILIFQGNYNVNQKNFELALENFETAFHIYKNEKCRQLIADTLFRLADNNFENKEVEQAKEFIERALVLYPNNEGFKKFFARIRNIEKKKRKKVIVLVIVIVIVIILALVAIWSTLYFIEKNNWEKARQENTFNSLNSYITKYPDGRFVSEANILIAKADSIRTDSIAVAILINIPYSIDSKLTVDSKVGDILKYTESGNENLPEKDGITSFAINTKGKSGSIESSVRYEFSSDIKEPVRKITGSNWYGEPTYAISGYSVSEKALLKAIEVEVVLGAQYIKNSINILNAFCPILEKQGYTNYSGKQQNIN
ncbi:MAG: tetratricopeptide repeat protein, partial [Bacteroidota bacterium]